MNEKRTLKASLIQQFPWVVLKLFIATRGHKTKPTMTSETTKWRQKIKAFLQAYWAFAKNNERRSVQYRDDSGAGNEIGCVKKRNSFPNSLDSQLAIDE